MHGSCHLKTAIPAARLVAMAIFALFLVACYETDQMVIRADQAMAAPELAGSYTNDMSGLTTEISAAPYSNDYHYRQVDEDGAVETGVLRVIALKDTLYLVQAEISGETGYTLTFYDFKVSADGSKEFESMMPEASDAEIRALASVHNVGIDDGMNADYQLAGDAENILAFLMAHKNYEFVPDWMSF